MTPESFVRELKAAEEEIERWPEGIRQSFLELIGKGAVFVGVDLSSEPDFTGLQCPRCKEPHTWRKSRPTRCQHCGVPFQFSNEVR